MVPSCLLSERCQAGMALALVPNPLPALHGTVSDFSVPPGPGSPRGLVCCFDSFPACLYGLVTEAGGHMTPEPPPTSIHWQPPTGPHCAVARTARKAPPRACLRPMGRGSAPQEHVGPHVNTVVPPTAGHFLSTGGQSHTGDSGHEGGRGDQHLGENTQLAFPSVPSHPSQHCVPSFEQIKQTGELALSCACTHGHEHISAK